MNYRNFGFGNIINHVRCVTFTVHFLIPKAKSTNQRNKIVQISDKNKKFKIEQ